jgi:DNA-binding transcriptional ArsR family regulator
MPTTRTASRSTRPSLAEIERVFEALAHEARRHVVLLLAHHGPELPSGYVASRLSHSWPTTTRHLHVLEAAGIVTVRREGRNCIYRIERDELRRVVAGWLDLLDEPTPNRSGDHRVPARSGKELRHD